MITLCKCYVQCVSRFSVHLVVGTRRVRFRMFNNANTIMFYRPVVKCYHLIRQNLLASLLLVLLLIVLLWPKYKLINNDTEWLFHMDATEEWFPDGIAGDNITGYPYYIVPNIVHYVMLSERKLGFVHYISIKSVLRHQKPEEIIFHCDCDDLEGYYWTRVKSESKHTNTTIRVRRVERPVTIFGVHFSREYHNWHASDIVRNRVLMEFGGIYLDRDVYVVKSMDPLRKYEMVLDFEVNKKCLGNQVQVAHKRARFLKLYLQTYQEYIPHNWYWNAGEYPTKRIVDRYPHLVHRVNHSFGVTGGVMCPILYQSNNISWKYDYYAIHLLIRGNYAAAKWCFDDRLPEPNIYFDEINVKQSNVTFGQMARLVLYNTTDLIHD